MARAEELDWLIADQLKAELIGAIVVGRETIVLKQTGSTNDAILQLASTHIPRPREGLVLFAEHQTAGRGQRGNRWESAAGKGLWLSILLRPGIDLIDSGQLTIWAIEAISDTIRAEFAAEPVMKLPNDLQLFGSKVAGVLVEMRAQENAPHLAVVGVGINVNQCREDFPAELQDRAISLAMALGRQVDRQRFAVALLRHLDLTYREKFSSRIGVEGGDLGSEIAPATRPQSTPAATTSLARTTTRGKRAAKFPTV